MAKEKKEKSENKKGKSIILIIVGLLVIGVAVFAGVYFGLASGNNASEQKPVVEAYSEMGEIMVNLSDVGVKRYAKITLTLSYDSGNKDLTTEIETKQVALRDTAIFYFKSLKAENFSANNEGLLKKELIDRLNKNLTAGLIRDVKFNELLVQ